jgi:hypothetical protein
MPDTDQVAAYLAEVRERVAATKTSAHGYTPRGEALPAGPCGEWLLANLAAAQHVPRLLAAVEAALEEHYPDAEPVSFCEGCALCWPCPTMVAISRALLGEGGQ